MKRDDARIATPCGVDWRAMSRRGHARRARLCSACDKLVHDLSAMAEHEARALLHAPPAEGLCIRYLHDANGNLWFEPGGGAAVVPASRLARHGAATGDAGPSEAEEASSAAKAQELPDGAADAAVDASTSD
jgi:hypothetical protein